MLVQDLSEISPSASIYRAAALDYVLLLCNVKYVTTDKCLY